MSHATIYVLDQDVAKDFYVNKLGFEVKVDQSLPPAFVGWRLPRKDKMI
jgi:catechol 2,3-dioxygenase-like lactoylglutathione lyase family enzyme